MFIFPNHILRIDLESDLQPSVIGTPLLAKLLEMLGFESGGLVYVLDGQERDMGHDMWA